MPRLIEPARMPEEVARAIETIGNRARMEILRALSAHGALTTTEVAEQVGARRESVHHHLLILENRGLVTSDKPTGERGGHTVLWTVNPTAVNTAFDLLRAYALGE